jgi:hypothetical protein
MNPSNALLSYQEFYDSADVDASPSYLFYSGMSGDVVEALANGWTTVVPDFEGPLAAFTAGVLSGHATIDSVRAILSLGHLMGLDSDAPYAMWGYSGGALASEWAAELQVQYAPELNFSGAALGGLTPNITSVLEIMSGGYAAGIAVVSFVVSLLLGPSSEVWERESTDGTTVSGAEGSENGWKLDAGREIMESKMG